MQTETTLTDRQMAFRKARRERQQGTKAAAILSKALGQPEEHTYTTDAKGRTVRECTIGQVPNEEIRFQLIRNRAVDEHEMLYAVGKHVLSYMIQKDYLRRQVLPNGIKTSVLMVTQAAAKNYDLPVPVVCGARCPFPA